MTISDSRQRLASHATTGRADLDRLLRARERDEIARLMRRLRRWHRELLPLAQAYDPAMVAYLEILRPEPQELHRIWRWLDDLPSGYQRGLCNAVEASLVRVNSDLRRHPDRGPKRAGRKRGRVLDDSAAVANARTLVEQGHSKKKAAEMSIHLADPGGQSKEANFWRVYRQI